MELPENGGEEALLSAASHPDLPEWLRELYPFRTRTLCLDRHRLSLVDEGPSVAQPGSPVFVLVHGNYTWSFLYRDLISRLRERYRVIAPDMMGFGLSDKPETLHYHTLDRHIRNFEQLMAVLDLQNVILVLHGWGGPIGLDYASRNPKRIGGLLLLSTWAGSPHRPKHSSLPWGMRLAEAGRLGRWLDSWFNLALHSALAGRAQRALPDLALEAYSFPFQRAPRVALAAWARMFHHPDQSTIAALSRVQTGLGNILAPAEILGGESDPVLGRLPAYLLRDDLKRAREPVFLNSVGHYLPEEAPEAVHGALRALISPSRAAPAERVFKILKS